MDAVAFAPTDGLCYDPSDPRYFDRALLQKELTRAFSLCASCRMCFKFCDSFAGLFRLLDERLDGDVRGIAPEETDRVLAACFQCKLCEVQCPYTSRDKHPFQLDFPKLVHRAMAVRARERGLTRQQRFLGDPDRSGRLARASLGLANRMNRFAPQRLVMEKALGIDRRKRLPDFASQSFEDWARRVGRNFEPGGEAVLFQTCFVQHNEPALGRDVLTVFDAADVDVRLAAGLVCCGMPAWEHGDLRSLRERASRDLALLVPHVEKGAKVLVVNPTCSMMLRREWPHLLEGADRGRAEMIAASVMDPCEFLWSIREEPRAALVFRSTPGTVAYHAPCHLRAQAVGFKGRELMRRIPGTEIKATVMECCGHNGTWAMRVEGFEASARIGKKAFDAMQEAGAEVWATECPLAAIQFEQHAGKRPLHPLTVLARAMSADGFPGKAG
ncbi:MAG TPA: heterodisulfide reductase-related iron-sulfur binding cluster [Myxococcales bacterium]|jgi:Fe-S oxidoreductase